MRNRSKRTIERRRNFEKPTAQHHGGRNAKHLGKRAREVGRIGKIGGVRRGRRSAFPANQQHGTGQLSPEQIAPEWQSELLFEEMSETTRREKCCRSRRFQ